MTATVTLKRLHEKEEHERREIRNKVPTFLRGYKNDVTERMNSTYLSTQLL